MCLTDLTCSMLFARLRNRVFCVSRNSGMFLLKLQGVFFVKDWIELSDIIYLGSVNFDISLVAKNESACLLLKFQSDLWLFIRFLESFVCQTYSFPHIAHVMQHNIFLLLQLKLCLIVKSSFPTGEIILSVTRR